LRRTRTDGDDTLTDMTRKGDIEPIVAKHLDRMRARGRRPRTVGNARDVLRRISRWAQGPILYLGAEDLDRWADARADQVDGNTLRGEMSVARGFYGWALREGLLTVDPTLRLESPRLRRTLPRPIDTGRLRQALATAARDGHAVMVAMLSLAAYAGLRCCEIADLAWDDIDRAGMSLLLHGKGGRERVVPMAPELLAVLDGLPGPRRGPVIVRRDGRRGHNLAHSISHWTSGWLHEVGIPETLHQLRHAFATAALEETGDLRTVQELLGHATPATTAIYTLVRPERLRSAVTGTVSRLAG